ncbi:C40 family peptidase [Mycobacterium sp. JS623]|uniref:C40 family peptidase n=1 Tax=Mycobacterium sp. JS623 TaxID=212767 RepID=UPI0002E5CF35|nr:C40 family peptidase [Mycobacterium sp. JS623]
MSIAVVVQQVGDVLARAHALFGDPVPAGHVAALDSGARVAAAGDLVRTGQARMAPLSGDLASRYSRFGAGAGPLLFGVAGTDEGLGGQLQAAVDSDQLGRADSGAVRSGAAGDTAALSPVSGTPAGQRALVAALRARLAQQQHIIEAQRAHDARLAAVVGSLVYGRRRAAGGGMPLGGMPFGAGGMGGGGARIPLGAPAAVARPRTMLASRVAPRAADIPGAPGDAAAKAALSCLGRPYVWGAKGPNAFDCSGLTQWAWRQAGVNLGGDTYSQIAQGVPVAPDQVWAGDLIFPLDNFGEDGRSGPGHVQLAISGSQVVHAPTTGDVVRIAPMPARFIARRPVPVAVEA